jgi:hypothetical protein
VKHTDNLEGLEDAIDGVWRNEDKDSKTGYAVCDDLTAKEQRIMQTGVVEFVITLCEKLGELEDAVQYHVQEGMETHQVLRWVQPDKLYEALQKLDPKTFVKKHLKGYHERFVKHSKLPAAKDKHALASALTKFKTAYDEHHKDGGDHQKHDCKCMHLATTWSGMWEPFIDEHELLVSFMGGIACACPTSCGVERDFSRLKYVKSNQQSRLGRMQVNGIFFAKDYERLATCCEMCGYQKKIHFL